MAPPDPQLVHGVGRTVCTSCECRYFLHGTTVGLSALLERTGAKVGLLATKGFRDVLEKRRSNYDEAWNPVWRPAAPLVPRRHRLPVGGRIAADGSVVRPLSADDVGAAVNTFTAEGIECIAIAFINAYASPQHELGAEAIVQECFEGYIVLSHKIYGEYREFERTATGPAAAVAAARPPSATRRLPRRRPRRLQQRSRGSTGLSARVRSGHRFAPLPGPALTCS